LTIALLIGRVASSCTPIWIAHARGYHSHQQREAGNVMATAKELRVWATTVKRWADKIDDAETAEHAVRLAAEMEILAGRKETAERQFV
jgi:hypothetical protein